MYPGTRSYGGSSGEQNEDWSRGRVLLRQRKKTKQLPAQLLLSCSGITAHAVIGPHFVFSIPKHLCAVFAVLWLWLLVRAFYIFLFHLMKYYFKTLLGCNVDENILLSSMQLNSSSLVCFVEIFLEESVLHLGKTKAIARGKCVLIISYPRKDGENNKIQSIFYKFKVSLLCHCQQWMSPKGFLLLLN